jgi:Holliday junction resolvase RusA-like endonuclease
MIRLELPYPPSVNTYWRMFTPKGKGRPRMIISERGRLYRDAVVAICHDQQVAAIEGPIAASILIYPRSKREFDVDNLLKSLLDSLQHGGCYADDSQIQHLVISKHHPRPPGMAIVTMNACAPAE